MADSPIASSTGTARLMAAAITSASLASADEKPHRGQRQGKSRILVSPGELVQVNIHGPSPYGSTASGKLPMSLL